jgi:anti-sigma B factor antagonist
MNITIETKGPVLLARVQSTQVGADTSDEFRSKVIAAIPREGARVALDLSQVEFMDSSGLGALVSLLKAVRPSGELVLFGLKPSVQEILRLTHLDSVFVAVATEDAAIATFTKPAATSA